MLYDGHRNTVIVEKDDIRFRLIPLVEESNVHGKESGYWEKQVLMCSVKEFLEEERKKQCYLTIIPKGPSVGRLTKDVTTNVREVLSNFKGVMVDEVSSGLPPLTIISH